MNKNIELLVDFLETKGINKKEVQPYLYQIEKDLKNKKYGLVWEEQKENIYENLKNKFPTLIEVKEKEIKNSENGLTHVLIEGDNLEVLTSLQYTHKNVDVIYIDPPYNTGNKDFKYNDSFVDKEDSWRHSKWVSFISKRLKLAKELLSESGVIFISIDEHEFAQLKLLCDDIFGEENFKCIFSWINSSNELHNENKYIKINGANNGDLKRGHEYILCYSKKVKYFKFNKINRGNQNLLKREITKNGNSNSVIKLPKGTVFRDKITKEFNHYVGGEKERIFLSNKMTVIDGVLQEDVELTGPFGERNLWIERFLNGEDVYDTKGQKILDLTITKTGVLKVIKEKHGEILTDVISNVGNVANETKKINQMLNINIEKMYPKPIGLIKLLIESSSKKDSIILDFFAGSGTTGHAVLELNKEDGGNRQFILCTNNENNICEDVTYQRLNKVMNGYTSGKGKEIEGLGGNLKYYKVELRQDN